MNINKLLLLGFSVTLLALLVALYFLFFSTEDMPKLTKSTNPSFSTNIDKVSYGFGLNLGMTFHQRNQKINLDKLTQGFKDTQLPEAERLYSATEVQEALRANLEEQRALLKQQQEENLKKNETYLAQNKSKEGVIVTSSGLQYSVLKQSEGKPVKLGDTFEVYYTGTLTDGFVFDQRNPPGDPARFVLDKDLLLPGWIEIIQLMPVGAKFHVVIPPGLGYGNRSLEKIPANSILEFDIEIVSGTQKAQSE